MKHWFGLVCLAVGIVIGLIVGASVTGFAAGNDEEAVGRYEIALMDATKEDWGYVFILDTQTGTVYRRQATVTWQHDTWHPVKPGDE